MIMDTVKTKQALFMKGYFNILYRRERWLSPLTGQAQTPYLRSVNGVREGWSCMSYKVTIHIEKQN